MPPMADAAGCGNGGCGGVGIADAVGWNCTDVPQCCLLKLNKTDMAY